VYKAVFSWNDLSCNQFQDLCVQIANKYFTDNFFQPYLINGQKQDGIDIYNINPEELHTCIQCKQYNDGISTTELKSAFEEFISNNFINKTKLFIIATTAYLGYKKTTSITESYKKILEDQYGVQYQSWDIQFLETFLKQNKNFVQLFFCNYQAEKYCLAKLKKEALTTSEKPEPYIQRSIINYNKRENVYLFERPKSLNLTDLLISENKSSLNKICLVGDPYSGKSTYLKYTSYLLEDKYNKQPIIIEIKNYSPKAIEDILNSKYGFWQEIPFHKLIIIIDGLDETSPDSFIDFAKHINEFAENYQTIPVILSCRSLFYEEYNLQSLLDSFEPYELYPLQYNDIVNYISNSLQSEQSDFLKIIEHNNLSAILYYPFYLIYLVELFKNGSSVFPKTKTEALSNFISNEYLTNRRRLPSGKPLNKNESLYNKTLQKLAFALQLSGLNSYQTTQINELFNPQELEILEQSALISIYSGKWSFVNALFQEHLAALRLSILEENQIFSYVSIGYKIRKLKLKWIQSYCTLISFTDDKKKLKKLIEFLERDNPELIFKTEKTKYDVSTIHFFLKTVIERCNDLNVFLFVTHEKEVAYFIEDCDLAIGYLIDIINNNNYKDFTKTTCTRILQNVKLKERNLPDLFANIRTEIFKTANAEYANNLLQLLAINKLGDLKLLDKLIKLPLNQHHQFRNGMYLLIVSLDLVEHFYEYGLSGIPILISYNKPISLGGSEYYLETFILHTNKPSQIRQLFQAILEPEWLAFNRFKTDNFYNRLSKKISQLVSTTPVIVFEIIFFFQRILEEHVYDSGLKRINELVENSNASLIVLQALINSLKEKDEAIKWKYGELITPDCFDYLLFEYEEDNISVRELQSLIHGLNQSKNKFYYDQFLQLCKDATENTIFPDNDYWEKDLELQKIRKRNDVACLQSLYFFEKAITKYFKGYGKKSIDKENLFVHANSERSRVLVDSDVISRFIIHYSQGRKIVDLNEFLNFFVNDDAFEYYRAQTILEHSSLVNSNENNLLEILEEYYNQKLLTANFENALWQENHRDHFRRIEVLLAEIFKKFEFVTDSKYLIQMIWMDASGIKNPLSGFNHKSEFSDLIISKLPQQEIPVLKKQIISNLQKGINYPGVLGNHIFLCYQLEIASAKDLILDVIVKRRLKDYALVHCVDIYLKLGGHESNLYPIFENITDYNDYLYLHLAKIIKDNNPDLVIKSLQLVLTDGKADFQIKVEAAKYLANLKSMNGFKFLADYVRANKQAPYSIQGNTDITKVDTISALNEIEDLMFILVDPQYQPQHSFHDSAKYLLSEWIIQLASKSEEDLLLVEEFLKTMKDKLAARYPLSFYDLNWYIIRINENFRNTDKFDKSIKEVKNILKELETN